ncbi:MAG: phosphoribosylamine--glycine ligase [Candidatus Omnitrophica bacterium]|nr:phosphoribosylamine--glycine ligase [Candidatus Omnitrophota bacterium]
MNVLLIGAGGREHALAWKLAQSPTVTELLVAPGSDGIAREPKTRCFREMPVTAIDPLLTLAVRERVDLTVVGPEAPLVAGVADRFRAKGLTVFGPSAAAARLEGSKAFAKSVMQRAGIPTAQFHSYDDPNDACQFVGRRPDVPWVVKADGLASGKGVLMPPSPLPDPKLLLANTVNRIQEASSKFGEKGVLEERLMGEEASLIGIADGARVVLLESAQDHKRLGDGDTGPNTGGMGAYSPAPVVTSARLEEIRQRIIESAVRAMAEAQTPFVGALYAGLMITKDGPKVLEYNVRFGDPETQAIAPRLTSDLATLLLAAATGQLAGVSLAWDPRPCVCVVLAASGYPEKPRTGDVITGIEEAAAMPDVQIFHAGTKRAGDRWVTAGGRVLNVVALGRDHPEAIGRAYEAAGRIQFDGKQCRRDIGARAVASPFRS